MRTYLLFDATGIVYLLVGLVALRVVWALGGGAPAWDALMRAVRAPRLRDLPRARAGLRDLRRRALLPALPEGAAARRSVRRSRRRAAVLHAMLYAAWGGITLVLLAVFGGIWP